MCKNTKHFWLTAKGETRAVMQPVVMQILSIYITNSTAVFTTVVYAESFSSLQWSCSHVENLWSAEE